MQETLIGFGASTMRGAGDSQGGWFGRAEKMADAAGLRARWINRGIGGNTTRDMLERTSTVTVHAPYQIVIILGCNDMPRARDAHVARRTTIDEYMANLDQILPRVRGTQSLFVSSFPVSAEKTGIDPHIFEGYMDAATACASKHGYAVWDLYNELQGKVEPYWAADGLHFNDAGHQFLAEQFVKRFERGLATAG